MGNNERAAAWTTGLAAVAGSALAGLTLTLALTPRPTAAVVKAFFERGGAAMAARMRPHVPNGVHSETGIPYAVDDPDAVLSVHRPTEAAGCLPVLIWVHGGGWVSGSNADVDPYLAILAARSTDSGAVGVVTVAVDYTQGPSAVYPGPVAQISTALRYLAAHAAELGIDMGRIMLAGDSAGAQLASQVAAMATEASYAERVGIDPGITADQLRGVMLYCGVFDLVALAKAPGFIGWAVGQVVWAYTGHQGAEQDRAAQQMSTINAVTRAFPPTMISGGNADPLTWNQSEPFAARLAELGVPVQAHFYPDDHQPALGHEFQFDLDNPDGQAILECGLQFMADRLS